MKNYVLDTNVLLHDPNAIFSFEENAVFIPIEVIEEIDRFKRESDNRGQNARAFSRNLDGLRIRGNLSEGIGLENGGKLRIVFPKPISREKFGPAILHRGTVDSQILRVGLEIQKRRSKSPTVLVSKDINLRIKADALGLKAEDYETDHVELEDLYTGMHEFSVSKSVMRDLKEFGKVNVPIEGLWPNEFCTLTEDGNKEGTFLARVDPDGQQLVPVLVGKEKTWGVKARNKEQRFALEALLDDRIQLVTLMGKAGTGKTLLAMAAGLKKTVLDQEYRRLVVARPTISMGKELGFLPGTLEEKLDPWMQPIHDALELLGDLNMGQENRRTSDLMKSGVIVVEALSYIRGRSISNQYIVIDEAQNLTPIEVKTIVTRVGPGTKIILTGDPYQIDNPYVDKSSNGFNYIVSRFRNQGLAAHIEMQKGERSKLAELAANLL